MFSLDNVQFGTNTTWLFAFNNLFTNTWMSITVPEVLRASIKSTRLKG
jgi:hypothetical protein